MALGLCCQWLELDSRDRLKNTLVSKSLQLGRFQKGQYSDQRIKDTYLANLRSLLEALPKVIAAGIRSMRVSSSMFPLHDRVPEELWNNTETLDLLAEIGGVAISNKMRITSHPDQFCVLSSDSETTVKNSLVIIEHHAWVFDCMGLPQTPYYAINVHGGKSNRIASLSRGIQRLNASARKRLTLENCEFAYSVAELKKASDQTGVPIVFDSHHHKFRTSDLSGEDAMMLAMSTWGDIKPLTHLSNTKEDCRHSKNPRERRKHSDFIYEIPEYQRLAHESGAIDIDIEAKKKNVAIRNMVNQFPISLEA